jgi:hypothetical protein
MLSFPARYLGQGPRARFANLVPATRWAELVYSSDGDLNGVFTLIGKNYLPGGTWVNPNTAGRLTIQQTGSSFDAASRLVNHDSNTSGTGNQSPSDWTFSLETGKSLLINKYSVQAASPANTSTPTGYQLQASADGTTWITLNTVVTGWNGSTNGAWITQSVDPGGVAYRFWRLHMHLPNFANANSFFILSEVELYGTLFY